MLHLRKKLSILLIAAILSLFPFYAASAASAVIYETTEKETVTSGAVLEHITRFTDDGWLNINVLRVDLSNPYINVGTLTNSDSIKTLATTKTLAQSKGAVAAINGGFFNWASQYGGGYPDGPVVESGKIITAASEYNRYNDSMATFSINNLNQVLYNYWKTDIALVTPDGVSTAVVGQYNKPSRDYTDFTILDTRWSNTSIGASANYPDIVEMVVDEGKVVEIRSGQPAVQIPPNGFVVITRQAGAQFLNSFKAGDAVDMSITTTPDWSRLKMAVTGSAILVQDGQIPAKFSMDIPGRNPRTAIGSSKDGKQLILAAVDGRQEGSLGMTQTETAQLMLDLGAWNALNLDGGGSTTMVTRKSGTSELEVVNNPSDGSPRKISTAIGIFSIAPPSALDGLIIDTEDTNVFVNTSRAFTVRGYDRYFNPIEVKPEQVKWSVSGVKGSFKGNVFYPTSVGDGKIKATVGSVSAELPISVLSAPAQLALSQSSVKLPLNGSVSFTVSGKNKNGYSAPIKPADIKWAVSGNIGRISEDTFTASAGGTGYIDASVGSTHAYCAVSVASETTTVKDSFEAANGTFVTSPANLPGGYEISAEQKHGGNSSGKLTYDFTTPLDATRAAYMALPNGGLPLDTSTVKLGVWVYNSHVSSDWLRAEISDTGGAKYRVDLAKSLDWSGWKYVEASLQGINSPALLTRIYLAQVNPVPDSGSIYLDDLTVTASAYPPVDMSKIPRDTVPVDDANKSVTYQQGSNSYRFAVFGQSREPGNLLERLLLIRLSEKINSSIDAAAFVGDSAHESTALVNKPVLSTNTGYKSFDVKDGRFVQLDMRKQSLRSGKTGQWQWFLQQLDSAKGSKIFIFMAGDPHTFSDSGEWGVFQEVLAKYRKQGKTVWVFYQGDKNASIMEKGIKYISLAGYDIQGISPDKTDAAKYLLVTVQVSGATFEFKPVID